MAPTGPASLAPAQGWLGHRLSCAQNFIVSHVELHFQPRFGVLEMVHRIFILRPANTLMASYDSHTPRLPLISVIVQPRLLRYWK
jgi:hypothetical protein